MSFRIDDILNTKNNKKNTLEFNNVSCVIKSYRRHSHSFTPEFNWELREKQQAERMLAETLLTPKSNNCYFRSISEPHICGNWYNNHKCVYPNLQQVFWQKDISVSNIRPECWIYSPTFTFIPQVNQHPKRKGGQIRFTPNQTDKLEKQFHLHKYLSPDDRKVLAESLKLSDRQVKTWFQNRRAKWRRCMNSSEKHDMREKYKNGS